MYEFLTTRVQCHVPPAHVPAVDVESIKAALAEKGVDPAQSFLAELEQDKRSEK